MAHVTHHHVPRGRPPSLGNTRRWQDWANMAAGALLAVSPWLLRYTGLEAATLNAAIIGFLIFALSALALTLLDRWEAYINGVLGIWAMLSPWMIGFAAYDMAKFSHLGLGALVMIIAATEIWQTSSADTA